jgi:hypothetical protein
MGTTEEALNFEREPGPVEAQKPVWRDVTVSITRNLWSMHAMSHRVLEMLGIMGNKMRSMTERGPDPDFAPDSRIQRIAVSGGDYRPPHNPEWVRRRNAIIDGLLIAGIIALVSTSIYLLKTTVRLDTQYTERGQLYDERFNAIHRENSRQDIELGRHDERLDRLEQQRRDTQRNADNQ